MATEKSNPTTAEKSATAKRPARRAAESEKTGSTRSAGRTTGRGSGRSPQRAKPSEIAAAAMRALVELTGREPEGATGLERTEDGWKVTVDVLDLRRVPSTTDVLASYEVEVDERGELLGYRRLHRYVRGTAGEE